LRKTGLYIVVIITIAFLIAGCEGIKPSMPDEEYDKNNTELAYLKIIPSKADMKVEQSKTFEVKAYNSDNMLIEIDISQIKWVVEPSCWGCSVSWELSPKTGSLKTTFIPNKEGYYWLHVNFGGEKGKWANADIYVN